jgi:hypothetical protein
MLDRKKDTCWYLYLNLNSTGSIKSIASKKLSLSKYSDDGFSEEELLSYIDVMKAGRKQQGNTLAPAHKKKIYPNDLCPCGSGLKYKKCCGRK